MKRSLTIIIITAFIIFISVTYVIKPPSVSAVSCSSVPISGNYTVSSSCEFSGTVNGVDTGSGATNTANITVNSGQTLTISAGQTVVFGGSITINGSISIVNTGQIRQTALWMTDADADNYPSSTTQTAQSTAPASGRRRNLMTSITSADCCDSDANAKPGQTTYFTTARTTCGGFDYDCNGTEVKNPDLNCSSPTLVVQGCTTTIPTGVGGYVTTIPACGSAGSSCVRYCESWTGSTCTGGPITQGNCTLGCYNSPPYNQAWDVYDTDCGFRYMGCL